MFKTLAGYQLNLRAAVSGLWAGHIDFDDAFAGVFRAIDRGLPQAWAEGAAECGIKPEEYTPDERTALAQAIANEKNHVFGLLDWVDQNSKENGGKRGTAYSRLDMWINRYRDVVNKAKTSACADRKMVWVLGPTEHCKTCVKLAGKIRRGSWWQANVMPQNPPNPKLECQGFNCRCELLLTDDRASSGPMPSLP